MDERDGLEQISKFGKNDATKRSYYNIVPENTHKGKCHCTANLLFYQLGSNQTSKSVDNFNRTKLLNPNK